MKTIDVKGKPYIEVNERLKEFRTNPKYAGYSLESDIIQLDNGVCTIKAIIKDAESRIIATGLAQEKENSSFINKTSYIENCETSAWGRALGNLGIGIDTSIASADEVLNAMCNQNKPVIDKSEQTFNEMINPDTDLLEGLKAITDMDNLKIYYLNNYNNATDKKAFEQAKDKRKKELSK